MVERSVTGAPGHTDSASRPRAVMRRSVAHTASDRFRQPPLVVFRRNQGHFRSKQGGREAAIASEHDGQLEFYFRYEGVDHFDQGIDVGLPWCRPHEHRAELQSSVIGRDAERESAIRQVTMSY